MPFCISDRLAARSATRAAILAVAIAIAFPTSVAAHGDWPRDRIGTGSKGSSGPTIICTPIA